MTREELQQELFDLVDKYFPKVNPEGGNKGRGEAMMIVAHAIRLFDKLYDDTPEEIEKLGYIPDQSNTADYEMWDKLNEVIAAINKLNRERKK